MAKAYEYGARRPTQGADEIRELMLLGHRYHNKLIEIERARRERAECILRDACPELVDVDERIAAITDEIGKIRESVKAKRQQRRRKVGCPESKEAIKRLVAGRKDLYARRKQLRGGLFAEEKAALQSIEDDAHSKQISARAANGLGACCGTYMIVEEACRSLRKGAPPKYRRRKPGGAIAVQIQGGMTWEDAVGGCDTRFRIEPIREDAWTHPVRCVRRRAARTRAWIRIGSLDASGERRKGGRTAVWAVVPVTIHRRIPENGRIKWVKLFERRVGTHSEWSLILSVEFPVMPKPDDLASDGVAGVDIGWRERPDGSLKVAAWHGSDGAHGEVVFDAEFVRRIQKVDDLRSIRDKAFDETRNILRDFMAANRVPEWLAERLKTLRLWKAQARLASVALAWRENRFAGDEVIFAVVEAWRKQDRHLYDWEDCQRKRNRRHRRELYRLFAVEMRRRYRTIGFEKINKQEAFAKLPPVENGDATADKARRNRVRAAVSVLVSCVKQCGADTIEVPAAYTSKTCSRCGRVNRKLKAEEAWTCPACGTRWDRDENAAINIMRRASGEVAAESPVVTRGPCGATSCGENVSVACGVDR